MTRLRPAVFLDRDGVLVEDVHHLHRSDQLRVIPGAGDALRLLRERGFVLVVVTNQSAVARGLCSEAELADIHRRLAALLEAQGGRYDALYYCPHHPTEGRGAFRVDCECRKPAPGMLLKAATEHRLDLRGSYLIGDKRSDMEAAHRAGCRGVFVRTGHGAEEVGALPPGTQVCADVRVAAGWIAQRPGGAASFP